jgi:hypothetical protein
VGVVEARGRGPGAWLIVKCWDVALLFLLLFLGAPLLFGTLKDVFTLGVLLKKSPAFLGETIEEGLLHSGRLPSAVGRCMSHLILPLCCMMAGAAPGLQHSSSKCNERDGEVFLHRCETLRIEIGLVQPLVIIAKS